MDSGSSERFRASLLEIISAPSKGTPGRGARDRAAGDDQPVPADCLDRSVRRKDVKLARLLYPCFTLHQGDGMMFEQRFYPLGLRLDDARLARHEFLQIQCHGTVDIDAIVGRSPILVKHIGGLFSIFLKECIPNAGRFRPRMPFRPMSPPLPTGPRERRRHIPPGPAPITAMRVFTMSPFYGHPLYTIYVPINHPRVHNRVGPPGPAG